MAWYILLLVGLLVLFTFIPQGDCFSCVWACDANKICVINKQTGPTGRRRSRHDTLIQQSGMTKSVIGGGVTENGNILTNSCSINRNNRNIGRCDAAGTEEATWAVQKIRDNSTLTPLQYKIYKSLGMVVSIIFVICCVVLMSELVSLQSMLDSLQSRLVLPKSVVSSIKSVLVPPKSVLRSIKSVLVPPKSVLSSIKSAFVPPKSVLSSIKSVLVPPKSVLRTSPKSARVPLKSALVSPKSVLGSLIPKPVLGSIKSVVRSL
jgi:hypothetical protein